MNLTSPATSPLVTSWRSRSNWNRGQYVCHQIETAFDVIQRFRVGSTNDSWHSACMIQPGPQVACCDPPRWPSSPPALHAAGATPSPPSSANSPGRWLSSLNQLLRDKTISPCYRHGSPRLRGRGALFPIESSPPWRQMVRTIFFVGFCPWLSPDGRMME